MFIPSPRQPTQRTLARLIIMLVVTVISVVGLSVKFTYFPRIDQTESADAIFVLGGNPYERYETAHQLARAGVSSQVVLSAPKDYFPGMQRLCSPLSPGYEVQCFIAQPWTTRGEAHYLIELMTDNRWDNVLVITHREHISRARYIVGRCTDKDVLFTDYRNPIPRGEVIGNWFYQVAAWSKAIFTQRGC